MEISSAISIISFGIIVALWVLMVTFTLVPFLLGLSYPMNSDVDLSFITTPLVGMSLITSVLWLGTGLVYPIVRNKVINRFVNLYKSGVRQSPRVSIIVPARNEENVIRNTVLNCLQQTYNNFEVIVVCHNCNDRTYQNAQVIDDNNRVRVFELNTAEAGKGIALNYAIDRSTGEYISILDSDGRLDEDFIKNALPLFSEGYAAIQ